MRYRVYADDKCLLDTKLASLKILDPQLDLELNKIGTFSFSIAPSHPYFNFVQKLRPIVKILQDEKTLFRGRILNITAGFYNFKDVVCEGELAFLNDSVQRPYDFLSGDKNTTIPELFTFFITNHNEQVDAEHQFKVGIITVTDGNDYIVCADSTYLNTRESIEQKLLNVFGGYLNLRYEQDGVYIDYLQDFNILSTQSIKLGKNLLDVKRIDSGAAVATAVIPLGAKLKTTDANGNEIETEERLTIASVNNGIDYISNQDALERYRSPIFKPVIFDDVTTPEALLRKGQQALAQAVLNLNTVELTAADMAGYDKEIESFKIGSYVPVESAAHSIDENMLVQKLSLKLLNPANNRLVLNRSHMTFTETEIHNRNEINNIVTNINNQYSNVINGIQQLHQNAYSLIEQKAEEIRQVVAEDTYIKGEIDRLIESINTQFVQTNKSFEMQFNEFVQQINGIDNEFKETLRYIRFENGNILIGEKGNEITLKLLKNKIVFLENETNEISYWANRIFYSVFGEFEKWLKVGGLSLIQEEDSSYSIV